MDARATLPDSLRLAPGTIFWVDLDGDAIYESGFTFTGRLHENASVAAAMNDTGTINTYAADGTWLPVATGYFIDYNGNGKLDTARGGYRDTAFGDRFFPFHVLGNETEFHAMRQRAFDAAVAFYGGALFEATGFEGWRVQFLGLDLDFSAQAIDIIS